MSPVIDNYRVRDFWIIVVAVYEKVGLHWVVNNYVYCRRILSDAVLNLTQTLCLRNMQCYFEITLQLHIVRWFGIFFHSTLIKFRHRHYASHTWLPKSPAFNQYLIKAAFVNLKVFSIIFFIAFPLSYRTGINASLLLPALRPTFWTIPEKFRVVSHIYDLQSQQVWNVSPLQLQQKSFWLFEKKYMWAWDHTIEVQNFSEAMSQFFTTKH